MNAINTLCKLIFLVVLILGNCNDIIAQYYNGTYVNSKNQKLIITNCIRGKSFEYNVEWGFETEGWEQHPEELSCFIDAEGVALMKGNEARDSKYDENQGDLPNTVFSLGINEICVSISFDYTQSMMNMDCLKFGDFSNQECFRKISDGVLMEYKAESNSESKYVEWGKKPISVGTDEGPPDAWTWPSMMCDGLCGISASSTLGPQGKFNYEPSNVCDDNPTTAWVEGAEDHGIGEFIEVDQMVMSEGIIYILNGYQSSKTSWENNSRVKKLKISFNGIDICIVGLADKMGVQFFKVPEYVMQLMLGEEITVRSLSEIPDGAIHKTDVNGKITYSLPSGGKLRFTIMDVYPGLKWKDTAISRIFSCGG